jgi:hypothetical protein
MRAAMLEALNVIDHITPARTLRLASAGAWMVFHELMLRVRAPLDLSMTVSRAAGAIVLRMMGARAMVAIGAMPVDDLGKRKSAK